MLRCSITATAERNGIMAKHKTLSRIGNLFATIGSAVAVASAVENRSRPRASDLRQLGIEPRAFTSIGHG
jgi:hypothetical protein